MNWSKQLKKAITPLGLALVLTLGVLHSASAQDENIKESQSVSISNTEDGKVKLKVIIKKGNDETTFEKTYDSHDEMKNDPDLEKYGINVDSFGFGRGFGGQPKFFFHNGPGKSFWDHDDFDMDIDSLRSSIRGMMRGFGPGSFSFGFNDDDTFDMDSLMQRFSFGNNNGRFSFNGEEIEDLDSLRAALKDKFGNMMFDFDFGDDDAFSSFSFGGDDDDVRVISRVKVFVRSARDEDKEAAGTDEMEGLELRDINFYPNPSDGRFDVELETGNDSAIQISIIDPEGNEVYNRTGTPRDGRYDFRVDLSDERKGIYIMKVVQNNKALTKRVIIE
ncbi:T9SS type A sorting domain-containing protein [Roseivirga sp. E12]|uniref:T9SS type A sorting domain-containing protein n=1 Tax=Roseivirga sp. E12 TaxID=2819237 RepID=UPI001ABCDA45|nr:T9SS type A sorting domain-containing protein [Roseivirga sp. E12]MBO3699964.1 T9SS type A sorting domain-containing protein [Roseivirga sp. E12]